MDLTTHNVHIYQNTMGFFFGGEGCLVEGFCGEGGIKSLPFSYDMHIFRRKTSS